MSRCDERLKARVEEANMPHIHWVARQNKLEIPNDQEDVNTREIHKCDGQAHDPDTMVVPLTPKPTRKSEALVKVPPTIVSNRWQVLFFPLSCQVLWLPGRVRGRKRRLEHVSRDVV